MSSSSVECLGVIRSKTGYECPPFELNGEIKRFGKSNNCWCVGHCWQFNGKEYQKVTFGNWSENFTDSWQSWSDLIESKTFQKKYENVVKELERKIDEQKLIKAQECRDKWKPKFLEANQDPVNEYMKSKGFDHNYCARNLGSNLLVPIYDSKQFNGVQVISKERKTFATGVKMKGSYCIIDKTAPIEKIFVAEGFATACSIYEATKGFVVCCFNCGNILPVVKEFRDLNPTTHIVVCADNDQYGNKNAGIEHAKHTALQVPNVSIIFPTFKDTTTKPTDFNDLHVLEGIETVKKFLTEKKIEDSFFDQHIKSGFTKITEKNARIRQYAILADYFQSKHSYIVDNHTEEVYLYNDGKYTLAQPTYIKDFAQSYFFPTLEKESEAKEFVHMVKRKNYVDIYNIKQQSKPYINFKNGAYNYVKQKLEPHSPDHYLFNRIDAFYLPNSECPTWDLLLQNISCGRQYIINVIEEFLGYCLSGMPYHYNKVLILRGSGANGKTSLINAMMNIIGKENCSAASITSLQTNRFEAIELKDKLANFSEEEPPKKVFAESGPLKIVTGNSPMKVEDKGLKGHMMINKAKLIMAYNEIPTLSDFSEGMRRRLLVVPCDMDLIRKPELKIANLYDKLEQEKSGIINRAIAGLNRLTSNGEFTIIPETKAEIKNMIKISDNIREFWSEFIHISNSPDDKISMADLYENYKDACGREAKSFMKFSKTIKEICLEISQDLKSNNVKASDLWDTASRKSYKGVSAIKVIF